MYGPPWFKPNVGATEQTPSLSHSFTIMLTGVQNPYEKILEISSLEIETSCSEDASVEFVKHEQCYGPSEPP